MSDELITFCPVLRGGGERLLFLTAAGRQIWPCPPPTPPHSTHTHPKVVISLCSQINKDSSTFWQEAQGRAERRLGEHLAPHPGYTQGGPEGCEGQGVWAHTQRTSVRGSPTSPSKEQPRGVELRGCGHSAPGGWLHRGCSLISGCACGQRSHWSVVTAKSSCCSREWLWECWSPGNTLL